MASRTSSQNITRVQGSGFRVPGSGSGFWVLGSGLWVLGSGNAEPRTWNRVLSQIRFQQPAQLLLCSIELRLQRAHWHLQRVGEIFVLHALKIVRRDQQSIVRRQSRDGFLEPIAQLEIA